MPAASAFGIQPRRLPLIGWAALAVYWAGAAVAEPGKPAPVVSEDGAVTRSFLEKRVADDPDDITALNRLSGIYLGQFRATGRYADLERADRAANASLKASQAEQNSGGLTARAKVDQEYHRFGLARDEARRLVNLAPKPAGPLLLLGDALFELGQPEEALKSWQDAAKDDDIRIELAMREARYHWFRGEMDAARSSYTAALDAIARATPPQPPAMVWAYVQRGQMAFMAGDWDAAEKDYIAAAQLAPEHFSVLDHLGELRAAQKRYPEAVAMYEQVVKSTDERPEFMQSLGDVQAAAGNPDEAKRWHEKALAGYLSSVQNGNGHYFHHLAGYYCDTAPDAAEAVKWARKDLELRQSVYAYDSLGWALYTAGDWAGAAEAAEKSLALNTPDAHLIYHAGMIFSRAGDLKRGGELLRRVAAVNPKYFNSFHVHR